MGRITKDDRCLIKGLQTEKKWGQTPNEKSFRTRDGLWQVRIVWLKKIDNCGSTEQCSGRPRSLRTTDNVSMIQDMMCSQDDAPCSHINPRKTQEHIEHCDLAWILFIKCITVTLVVADGPLTSINQTCASILAVVYEVIAKLRQCYHFFGPPGTVALWAKNHTATCHNLLRKFTEHSIGNNARNWPVKIQNINKYWHLSGIRLSPTKFIAAFCELMNTFGQAYTLNASITTNHGRRYCGGASAEKGGGQLPPQAPGNCRCQGHCTCLVAAPCPWLFPHHAAPIQQKSWCRPCYKRSGRLIETS